MDMKRYCWSRTLIQDSTACHREAHSLRVRLEELMAAAPTADTGLEPGALRGGHAAMLAVTVLGAATSQKIVGFSHWLRRIADFARTVRQYSQSQTHDDSTPFSSPTPCHHPDIGSTMQWTPFEYETTEAEDEIMPEEGEGEPRRVTRPCTNPIGVNLYLYMEDALAQAAEGLMGMPALSGTITEGLIAIRGVEVGLCQAVSEFREALVRMPAAQAAQEAVHLTTAHALEEAAAMACKVAHRVLRAVHRGVALMQVALDGIQASAERRAHNLGLDLSPSSGGRGFGGIGEGGGAGADADGGGDDDPPPPPPHSPPRPSHPTRGRGAHRHANLQRRLIRIAAADGSGLLPCESLRFMNPETATRLRNHLQNHNNHNNHNCDEGDGGDGGGTTRHAATAAAAPHRLKVNLKVKFVQRQMDD